VGNGEPDKPGDFCYDEKYEHIYIVLPGLHGQPDALRIQRGEPGGERVWGWDGNVANPTLTPSIEWKGHWHGHMTNGRLVSC
jgi:hypothetical protein